MFVGVWVVVVIETVTGDVVHVGTLTVGNRADVSLKLRAIICCCPQTILRKEITVSHA